MESFNNQPKQNESEVSKESVNNREKDIVAAQQKIKMLFEERLAGIFDKMGKEPYFEHIEQTNG